MSFARSEAVRASERASCRVLPDKADVCEEVMGAMTVVAPGGRRLAFSERVTRSE